MPKVRLSDDEEEAIFAHAVEAVVLAEEPTEEEREAPKPISDDLLNTIRRYVDLDEERKRVSDLTDGLRSLLRHIDALNYAKHDTAPEPTEEEREAIIKRMAEAMMLTYQQVARDGGLGSGNTSIPIRVMARAAYEAQRGAGG